MAEEGLGYFGGYFNNFLGGGFMNIAVAIVFGTFVLGCVGAFAYWAFYKKKNWNLKIEFKFPRSDGKIITSEWGKGCYDPMRGVVLLKRKGKKPVPMIPFDVKKYLQGTEVLTVIQVGVEQYIPVLVDSYIHMQDDKTNEEAALMKMKIDLTQSKSWRNQFEREAKQSYTILGLLQQYANFIGIGLILMMQLVGFAILYTRVTG